MSKRLTIEDIFKPGGEKNVRTGFIDFQLPENAELKQMFEDTKRRQKEIMERARIDINELRNTIITI